jgi:glycosyltransferase involved in cell wall biosynthesis
MLRYPICLPTVVEDALGERVLVQPSPDLVALYQIGLQTLQDGRHSSSLRLVTDSSCLAREYRRITDCSIDVVPIPHTHPEGLRDEVFCGTLPGRQEGQIRIVYLGDARGEKGFGLLPFAVMALTERFGTNRLQFVLQSYVSSPHHEPMNSAIAEMESLNLSNLHLIKRPLSEAEYHTLLGSADLVLLPYDGLVYRSRTSGPFVEALCTGKPVVIPAQTWMADELGGSRAGTLFQESTDAEFYSACVSAIEDLPLNTRAAQEFSQSYKRFHNPRSFVEQMFGAYVTRHEVSPSANMPESRVRLHSALELIGDPLASGKIGEGSLPFDMLSHLRSISKQS